MRREQHQRLITLALKVLDVAAYHSRTERVAHPHVQLALRVLLPYVADRADLLAYWEKAQGPAPHPWDGCRGAYKGIAEALRANGWDAPP
jgi:hypothetical protein